MPLRKLGWQPALRGSSQQKQGTEGSNLLGWELVSYINEVSVPLDDTVSQVCRRSGCSCACNLPRSQVPLLGTHQLEGQGPEIPLPRPWRQSPVFLNSLIQLPTREGLSMAAGVRQPRWTNERQSWYWPASTCRLNYTTNLTPVQHTPSKACVGCEEIGVKDLSKGRVWS